MKFETNKKDNKVFTRFYNISIFPIEIKECGPR